MRNSQEFLNLLLFTMMEDQPRYGYELLKEIEKKSGGYWQPGQGTVYGALERLEKAGKIQEVGYGEDQEGGNRQYYGLTDAGRAELEELRERAEEEVNPENRVLGLLYIYRYLAGEKQFELLLDEIQEEFFE